MKRPSLVQTHYLSVQDVTACVSIAEAVRGATVFVQYEPQSRIEGDLQQLPAELVGQWMSLIPELLDPKDLISLIRPDWGSLAPASPRAARVSAVAGAHIKKRVLAV